MIYLIIWKIFFFENTISSQYNHVQTYLNSRDFENNSKYGSVQNCHDAELIF